MIKVLYETENLDNIYDEYKYMWTADRNTNLSSRETEEHSLNVSEQKEELCQPRQSLKALFAMLIFYLWLLQKQVDSDKAINCIITAMEKRVC